MTKKKNAEAEKPVEVEPKPLPVAEEVVEGMANLLHNLHGLDTPSQLRRQELLGQYRELNPKWEAVRVHH